jgi:hypothetical protein
LGQALESNGRHGPRSQPYVYVPSRPSRGALGEYSADGTMRRKATACQLFVPGSPSRAWKTRARYVRAPQRAPPHTLNSQTCKPRRAPRPITIKLQATTLRVPEYHPHVCGALPPSAAPVPRSMKLTGVFAHVGSLAQAPSQRGVSWLRVTRCRAAKQAMEEGKNGPQSPSACRSLPCDPPWPECEGRLARIRRGGAAGLCRGTR